MSRRTGTVTTLFALLIGTPGASAADDEAAAKLAEQKKAAVANMAQVGVAETAEHETPHLFLVAPKDSEKKLKDWGAQLEKAYTLARAALKYEEKEELWPGKLTVYFFDEREHFTAFVRRIEKRRLEADESGSYNIDSEKPHVAASPPRTKYDLSVDLQAIEQLAGALLARKAGRGTVVAGWVVAGFGRATVWRATPAAARTTADRRASVKLVQGGRTAADVWNNNVDAEDAVVLRGSLMEYLAYGPGANRFVAFVEGFKPGENQTMRTAAEAMQAASIMGDRLAALWKRWAVTAR